MGRERLNPEWEKAFELKHLDDLRVSGLKYIAGHTSGYEPLIRESAEINRWWGHPPYRDVQHATESVLLVNKFMKKQRGEGNH